MKKRILTLLAAVCLLSAVLSGCGGGSQNGTTGTTDQSTANTQTEGPAARAAAGAPVYTAAGAAFSRGFWPLPLCPLVLPNRPCCSRPCNFS